MRRKSIASSVGKHVREIFKKSDANYLNRETEAVEKRQQATEDFLVWLAGRAAAGKGLIQPFTQVERCEAMGYKMNAGMAVGNVQSRVDFACFRLGLPPLGLTAKEPFKAWEYDGKAPWAYPVLGMTKAALERRWTSEDFEKLLAMSRTLPEVRKPWVSEELAAQRRQWAALFGSTEPGEDICGTAGLVGGCRRTQS